MKPFRFPAIALISLAAIVSDWPDRPLVFAESPPTPGFPVRDPRNLARVTPESQRSIELGTEWLVSAIQRHGVGVDIHQPPDLSCTAMVGLVLLSQGNTLSGGRHASDLRRVLEAVLFRLDQVPEDYRPRASFTLVQTKIGRNVDMFLSALFLSQMLGDSGYYEKDVRSALEKLVRIIGSSQGEDGTWGNESWAPVLGTVLGWESLRAAHSCGLSVHASAERAGDALMTRFKAKASDEDWMRSFYKEAAGIRVLHSLGHRDDPVFEDCVQRLIHIAQTDRRHFVQAGGEEYLAFFLVTECLLQEPRPAWQPWYPTVRDNLIKHQNRDGSWSGHHCITARTFCTAAALLTLQAPYRFLSVSDL
ncbi:hypothetical protein GC163_20635 [bacterium]|nr:hypothetical protein [bacterium]